MILLSRKRRDCLEQFYNLPQMRILRLQRVTLATCYFSDMLPFLRNTSCPEVFPMVQKNKKLQVRRLCHQLRHLLQLLVAFHFLLSSYRSSPNRCRNCTAQKVSSHQIAVSVLWFGSKAISLYGSGYFIFSLKYRFR